MHYDHSVSSDAGFAAIDNRCVCHVLPQRTSTPFTYAKNTATANAIVSQVRMISNAIH